MMQRRLTSAIRTMRSSRAAEAEVEEASAGLSEVCQLISTLNKRQGVDRGQGVVVHVMCGGAAGQWGGAICCV